ncbi:hypothetical protein D9M73_290270 [compost metagenome]
MRVFQRMQPGIQRVQRQVGLDGHRVVEEIRAVETDGGGPVGRGDHNGAEARAQGLHRGVKVLLRLQVAAQAQEHSGHGIQRTWGESTRGQQGLRIESGCTS